MAINVNFNPSIKQFKAWNYLCDDTTLFVGYGGGAFSGKSYMLCYWLTTMCIAYPETAWGLGRKELINLKKTTLVTLFKVFQESGIEKDTHYNYNQQENKITFYNGSIIYLIDTAYKPSDPLYTRFGGLELTGAAIDESAETSYSAIKILFTRLGRKNNHKYGLKKKLLETFNPDKGHVYTRYYKPHRDGNELEAHVFIPALPKDNPSPEVEDYIKDIKATSDQVTIERLINGNFEYSDDPSTLMAFDNIQNLFTNKDVVGGLKYITADIARMGRDKTVIGIWNGFRLERIVTMDKNLITEASERIKGLALEHKVPMKNVIVDADGIGSGVFDILKCEGFVNNSRPMPNPVTKEVENFNNIKSQMYFKLAEKVNAGEVFINVNAGEDKEYIIQELEQVKSYKMDNDGKKQVLPKDMVKELIGRSPDYSDMIMMRMWFEYAKLNQRPGGTLGKSMRMR